MRRIVSIACICVLCFLLIIPVSAASSQYSFNGYLLPLAQDPGGTLHDLYKAHYDANQSIYMALYKQGTHYYMFIFQRTDDKSQFPLKYDKDTDVLVSTGPLLWIQMNLDGDKWVMGSTGQTNYEGIQMAYIDSQLWSSDTIYNNDVTKEYAVVNGDIYWSGSDDGIVPFLPDDAIISPGTPEDETSGILGWLRKILDGILGIPNAFLGAIGRLATEILDGIKGVFLPDTEYIHERFDQFVETLGQQWNFDTEFFTSLFNEEKPVGDITGDYKIHGVGTLNLKFFDASFFRQGIEFFRPFIRGFLVLLMVFFNIKMVLSFIRQDAGMATGKAVEISNGDRKGS